MVADWPFGIFKPNQYVYLARRSLSPVAYVKTYVYLVCYYMHMTCRIRANLGVFSIMIIYINYLAVGNCIITGGDSKS